MSAAGRAAGVIGTGVPVAARSGRTAGAGSTRTGISRGAGISVIARSRVVHVRAAYGRIAEVVRAHAAIVAIPGRAADAESSRAGVACGARISIVAGIGVWSVDTSRRRRACICRTRVLIVARDRWTRRAAPGNAVIPRRTRIPVVTRSGCVGVGASARRATRIGGAGIVIVAVQRCASHASTARARISSRTCVPIVAGIRVQGMETSGGRIAAVGGAGITVLAIDRGAARARARRARTRCRAGVSIVAAAANEETCERAASRVGGSSALTLLPRLEDCVAAGRRVTGISNAVVVGIGLFGVRYAWTVVRSVRNPVAVAVGRRRGDGDGDLQHAWSIRGNESVDSDRGRVDSGDQRRGRVGDREVFDLGYRDAAERSDREPAPVVSHGVPERAAAAVPDVEHLTAQVLPLNERSRDRGLAERDHGWSREYPEITERVSRIGSAVDERTPQLGSIGDRGPIT